MANKNTVDFGLNPENNPVLYMLLGLKINKKTPLN